LPATTTTTTAAAHPAYSHLVTGQAITPVEVLAQSNAGNSKKKGKGKVLLHFG